MASLAQLARVVIGFSPSNDIEALVQKKLENLGEEFLMEFIGGPFGAGAAFGATQRISQAIGTGALGELAGLGESAIRRALPAPLPGSSLLNKVQDALSRRGHGSRRSHAAWGRTDWATSRNDWLDNRWQHDWRSQPRDEHGRWVPGRLNYIEQAMQYRGSHAGRRKLSRLKARRLGRRIGRQTAKRLLKKRTKYGG